MRYLSFALPLVFATSLAAQTTRYVAERVDGGRFVGDALAGWHAAGEQPTLGGERLFDPARPVRFVLDQRAAPPAAPRAFVEFVCGDVLPGEVTRFVAAGGKGDQALPDLFEVQTVGLQAPTTTLADPAIHVRVLKRFVRRVVWPARRDACPPGAVVYRDGRVQPFRAARFADDQVHLLTEEGASRARFAELAELCFPAAPFWPTYFDELALTCPDGSATLTQIETTHGLSVTASLDRFTPSGRGNPRDHDQARHILQPAWSVEPLWVAAGEIAARRFFRPHETPLSRLPIARQEARSPLLGAGPPAQRDRGAGGAWPSGGNQLFAWGWGAHAQSLLAFDLPEFAVAFETRVGLDRRVESGGCARARVKLTGAAAPLFESDFLVGSGALVSTGRLALPAGAKQLLLEVDPAHQPRPPQTDPLDIRDDVNWLGPLVVLDEARVRDEIRARAASRAPAWAGWTVPEESAAAVVWSQVWREPSDNGPGEFVWQASAGAKPLRLTRDLEIGPQDGFLLITAGRLVDSPQPATLEIRIDGDPIAEHTPPRVERARPQFKPFALSLAPFRGKRARLEITQAAAAAPAPIWWRKLETAPNLPNLMVAFDDQGAFQPVDDSPPGGALVTTDDRFSGQRSVKIPAGGRYRLKLPKPVSIRPAPEWGEFRYLRMAFRKFGKGRVCVELGHEKSADKPFRYDGGAGLPSHGAAKRVWALDLPSEWIVLTQDVYGDFGACEITELIVSCPDGEHALFDHLVFARENADFSLLKAPLAEVTNHQARQRLARETLDKVQASVVLVDAGDKPGDHWAAGVVFQGDGLVATSGQAVVGPQRAVTVLLPDGQRLKGETLGVYRDANLGLVKLTEGANWPVAPLYVGAEFELAWLYAAAGHPRGLDSAREPEAQPADILRVFRHNLWVDGDNLSPRPGAPLINKNGQVAGLCARRGQGGGWLFSRAGLLQEAPIIDRLKARETFGAWPRFGSEQLGVEISSILEGCRVTKRLPGAPADNPLRVGDVIERVEGRGVVSWADVHEALQEHDPGREATLAVLRAGKRQEFKVKVLRVP